MNNKKIIEEIYEKIADELNISDYIFEKANKSYKALGEYLSNNIQYPVSVFPQGSMNLGTIIKPISDDDDYDLDAVCKISAQFDLPSKLKNIVGDVLKCSKMYGRMLDDEGKRCWTLKYSDDSHFHMDVLPAVSNNAQDKSLKITHKENGIYEYRVSNPEAYAEWFDKLQENERINLYRKQNAVFSNNIEDLRRFNIRTNLQKTIQLLKRHRDIQYLYASDKERDCKPISIIITTLVGRMYTGNETIVELICKFCNDFEKYIEIDSNGNYKIANPINSNENFADKWNIYPERREAFYKWVSCLRNDLVTNNFMIFDDIIQKSEYLKKLFGNKIVEKVFENSFITFEDKYIERNGIATLTSNKTDLKIRKHTFYGK